MLVSRRRERAQVQRALFHLTVQPVLDYTTLFSCCEPWAYFFMPTIRARWRSIISCDITGGNVRSIQSKSETRNHFHSPPKHFQSHSFICSVLHAQIQSLIWIHLYLSSYDFLPLPIWCFVCCCEMRKLQNSQLRFSHFPILIETKSITALNHEISHHIWNVLEERVALIAPERRVQ